MKYKVIALTVSGLGKKIHRNGDEVFETDFPKDRAKELVKSGFLQEIPESESPKKVVVPPVEKNPGAPLEKNDNPENILEKIAKETAPKKAAKK